jgi:hypothetical protein
MFFSTPIPFAKVLILVLIENGHNHCSDNRHENMNQGD